MNGTMGRQGPQGLIGLDGEPGTKGETGIPGEPVRNIVDVLFQSNGKTLQESLINCSPDFHQRLVL